MKKVALFSMMALMIIALSAFVIVTTHKESNQDKSTEIFSDGSLIIKQTLTFQDSSEVVIYYSKTDSEYTVHSETDLSQQSPKSLLNLTNTTLEVVSERKGDCYVRCKSVKEVLDLGSLLYSKYGSYLNLDNLEVSIQ